MTSVCRPRKPHWIAYCLERDDDLGDRAVRGRVEARSAVSIEWGVAQVPRVQTPMRANDVGAAEPERQPVTVALDDEVAIPSVSESSDVSVERMHRRPWLKTCR